MKYAVFPVGDLYVRVCSLERRSSKGPGLRLFSTTQRPIVMVSLFLWMLYSVLPISMSNGVSSCGIVSLAFRCVACVMVLLVG